MTFFYFLFSVEREIEFPLFDIFFSSHFSMAAESDNTYDSNSSSVRRIYRNTVSFHSYIKSCRIEGVEIYNHLWRTISHAFPDVCPQTATCDAVEPVAIYKTLDFLETTHAIKVPRLGDSEDPIPLDVLVAQKLFSVIYKFEHDELRRIEHVMEHMKSHLEKTYQIHRKNVEFDLKADSSYVVFRNLFQPGPLGDILCLLTHTDLCIGYFVKKIDLAAIADMVTEEGHVPAYIESKPDLIGLRTGLRGYILQIMTQIYNIPSEELESISIETDPVIIQKCIRLISENGKN